MAELGFISKIGLKPSHLLRIETWLELASAVQFDGQGDHHTPSAYVEQAFRKYLAYGTC